MENDNTILKECQALHSEIIPERCAEAQLTLPQKYCEGCDWCSPVVPLILKPKKREVKPRSDYKYIVYVSKKVKEILINESNKLNIQPAAFIAKCLAEKLLPK